MRAEPIIKTNINSKLSSSDSNTASTTKIERKPYSAISEEDFIENFYTPEKPVILTGTHCLAEKMCNPEYIRSRFWDDSLKRAGWYSASLPDENDDIQVPSIYRTLCSRDDTFVHQTPMRLWVHPKGNRTPWHYDSGGCHGFNVQVTGRKRWTIVSPQTPLPSIPLIHINAVDIDFVPDSNKTIYYDFITGPGDMLFLPRGWAHTVQTLEDVNINVNWLLTPVKPNLNTLVGKRECEIIKLINTYLSIIIVKKEEDDNTEYLAREFIENNVSSTSALLRLIKEICNFPRAFYCAPNLVPAMRKYLRNSVA